MGGIVNISTNLDTTLCSPSNACAGGELPFIALLHSTFTLAGLGFRSITHLSWALEEFEQRPRQS